MNMYIRDQRRYKYFQYSIIYNNMSNGIRKIGKYIYYSPAVELLAVHQVACDPTRAMPA